MIRRILMNLGHLDGLNGHEVGYRYGVIRGAVSVGVPGLILEHSFHTNTRATNWLLDESNLDKMARAEAKIIADHYGVDKSESEGVKTVNIEMSVLKKGEKGEQVKTLQRLLLALGYDLGGYGADGSFGGATDKAVRAFQKDNGLSVDGSVGKNTWNKLLKG